MPKETKEGWGEEAINQMVNRFLGWKLPENFMPDGSISFEPELNKEYLAKQGKPPMRNEPSGTNLFDAIQAKEMIRYILGSSFKEAEQRVAREIFTELLKIAAAGEYEDMRREVENLKHQYDIKD